MKEYKVKFFGESGYIAFRFKTECDPACYIKQYYSQFLHYEYEVEELNILK